MSALPEFRGQLPRSVHAPSTVISRLRKFACLVGVLVLTRVPAQAVVNSMPVVGSHDATSQACLDSQSDHTRKVCRCFHGPIAPPPRPRVFGIYDVAIGGGAGFAVDGCFDGAPTAPNGVDMLRFNVAYRSHPPLTPEEREELQASRRQCDGSSGPIPSLQQRLEHLRALARKRMLELKDQNFAENPFEVLVLVTHGTSVYRARNFELTVEGCDKNDGATNVPIVVTPETCNSLPRPWMKAIRPLSFHGDLYDFRKCTEVDQAVGSIQVSFQIHQCQLAGFGSIQLNDSGSQDVLLRGTCRGTRCAPPIWHRWCRGGSEDEGVWDVEEAGDHDDGDDSHGQSGKGNEDHGNNGVGNGTDPQPPGNPPINDGEGTSPGNPGNRGAGKKDVSEQPVDPAIEASIRAQEQAAEQVKKEAAAKAAQAAKKVQERAESADQRVSNSKAPQGSCGAGHSGCKAGCAADSRPKGTYRSRVRSGWYRR